jgi:hypothetical protein
VTPVKPPPKFGLISLELLSKMRAIACMGRTPRSLNCVRFDTR